MAKYDSPGCCPPPAHPPLPQIAAGQSTLARQQLGFPQWRRALLADIRNHTALAGWTADSQSDLGTMLLEFWAYVLDITAFYDARIAERGYLGTAHDAKTAAEIATLIGFVPRPALSAQVELALEARGHDPVAVPPLTAFRSEAFGEHPPQVFETLTPHTAWPPRNRWQVGPIRKSTFDGEVLRFESGEGPSRGAVVAISVAGKPAFAGRVARVSTQAAPDGRRYLDVLFGKDTSLAALEGEALEEMEAQAMGLRIGLSKLAYAGVTMVSGFTGATIASGAKPDTGDTVLFLDALYPQLAAGQVVVLEAGGALHAVTLKGERSYALPIGPVVEGYQPNMPLSQVWFAFASAPTVSGTFLHVNARPLGTPTRPAESEIELADLKPAAPLVGPLDPMLDAPTGGDVIAVGAKQRGARLAGTLDENAATFVPGETSAAFERPLAAPLRLYGNIATAIRGETVRNEVLGSGDASLAFQRFRLKKKPLSWIEDGAVSLGRVPRIPIVVDGIIWRFVASLYGQPADARVFIIDMEADGTAYIAFGDGETGARLPTGVANITASYAFGAGAAKPPAGSIKQLVRPPKDLKHVASPLAPTGGADAQDVAEIAELAPGSSLVLDRAVSATDYLVMSRNFSGILNAAVTRRWDGTSQREVVEIGYIAESGEPGATLRSFLEARSAPGVAIEVRAATKVPVDLFEIAIDVAPDHSPDPVREAVRMALFDPISGFLSPARIPIGAPLFRSTLLAAIHGVAGVRTVTAIRFGSAEMAYAETPGAGAWFDLLANGKVT